MTRATDSESILWLVFLTGGQVALEDDGEQVWSSDDDEDFLEEFGDAFHDADDAEEILAYLVDEGILTEDEADTIDIDVESLNDAADEPDSAQSA